MASQVAHIIYADKFLEKFPMNESEQELFFLGSVFPDIRRIDPRIRRSDTHLKFPSIDLDFSSLDPFEAGWKFHLFCDMKREEILRNNNFYLTQQDESIKWLHAGKLLEDRLVYGEFDNWEKMVAILNNPPRINSRITSRETLELWFSVLARYMEKRPDSKSIQLFLVKQEKLPAKAGEIIEAVTELEKDARIVETLKGIKEKII